jgi:hypothetical protein
MRPGLIAPTLSALVSIFFVDAARGAEETIQPGYWESVDTVTSPIRATNTDRRCVGPTEIANFMGCRLSKHYTCTCADQSYSGGKIHFRGECVDKKGQRVQIAGDGTYTRTTLNLTADVTFNFMGAPLYGQATSQAHRIADTCPADAK